MRNKQAGAGLLTRFGAKLSNQHPAFDNYISFRRKIAECPQAFDNFASSGNKIIECISCIRQFQPDHAQIKGP